MDNNELYALLNHNRIKARTAAAHLGIRDATMSDYLTGARPINRLTECAIRWVVHCYVKGREP
jgi:hypothetical protein